MGVYEPDFFAIAPIDARAGMGLLDPIELGDDPYGIRPTPPYNDGSDAGPWGGTVPVLIGGGIQALRDIFAPVGTSTAAYRAQQQQYIGQQPVYNAPSSQYLPPRTSGVGFGLDSQGIRLSDGSHIGWFPIIGCVVVLFLIQSPGFTRRR
jgi:hypothetical protein